MLPMVCVPSPHSSSSGSESRLDKVDLAHNVLSAPLDRYRPGRGSHPGRSHRALQGLSPRRYVGNARRTLIRVGLSNVVRAGDPSTPDTAVKPARVL